MMLMMFLKMKTSGKVDNYKYICSIYYRIYIKNTFQKYKILYIDVVISLYMKNTSNIFVI